MTNAILYVDRSQFESPQKHRWQDSALCAQTDPEIFFPNKGQSYTEARKVCGSCLVRSNCLEKALADEGGSHWHDRIGMLGGLTPAERYALYRKQKVSKEVLEEITSQIAA